MARVVFLPPAARYLKKLKDKQLKTLFKNKVDAIAEDPTIGEPKHGDLEGISCCDIFYNKTNYELAYRIEYYGDEVVVVIMAGTRENFYQELKRYL